MKRLVLLLFLGLAGCSTGLFAPQGDESVTVGAPMSAMAPPPDATTEEAFDTTTVEERLAAASAAPETGAERLGTTVASLGSPTAPGFWLETPLVDTLREGRVEAENGKTANLELRPIDGPSTAGSRISLPALRVLEVGLTGLHNLTVFAK